ncbi:hypothetical protein AQJ64_36915 [Streptomyces griseoruber]|uniref:Uncharacterized protein n=1 Tax=Streptomyces griseoruber TaxID=1943 RepID=A0A117R893_9ACTN|nr:hypothetical protein AQJ64_36915 [Streptomyces griseoruber]
MFARTSGFRRRVVACRAFMRILVRKRQDFRFAKPCSTAARSRLNRRFASFLVGQREKQQAMGFVLAGEVLPAVRPGATARTDEGAVQQDHDSAAACDLLQRPVQSRGSHSQEFDRLLHPATHGGGGDVVAAGHVGQALVVAEYGEHDNHLGARGELAPPGAQLVASAAYQAGDEIDGLLRQRETDLVDNILRAFGGLVFRHKFTNSRRRPCCYGRNRPVRHCPDRSARQRASRAGP